MNGSANKSKIICKTENLNNETNVNLKTFKNSFDSHEETIVRHIELSNNFTNKTSTKMSTTGSFFKNTSRIFESSSLISPIFALQLDTSIFKSTQTPKKSNADIMIQDVTSKNDHSHNDKDSTFVHTDGGKGWLVVLASCWCFGIILTMQNTYSLLYNNMVETYKNTTNHVLYAAWIGSTSNGFQFLASIPSSLLVDLFRPRLVGILGGILSTVALVLCALVRRIELYFITFSIIFGFGQSLLLISTFAILPHYFNKKIGLANGLMNMGASLITITVPILIGECLNKLGLHMTWLVLAGLCFVTILCAFVFKPLLPKKCLKNECEKIRKTFGLEILRNYKFLNWSVACFLGIGGSMIPLLTMTHHSSIYFPNHKPELLNVIFASASGLAALIFGKIGDLTNFSRIWYHLLAFLLSALIQIFIPHASAYYQLAILIGILGVGDGIYLCSLVPILFEIANCPKLSNQFSGYYHSFIAIPVIIGPAVSGLFFERFNDYTYAYYLGSSCCLLCSLILAFNTGTFLAIKFKKTKYVFRSTASSVKTDPNNNNNEINKSANKNTDNTAPMMGFDENEENEEKKKKNSKRKWSVEPVAF